MTTFRDEIARRKKQMAQNIAVGKMLHAFRNPAKSAEEMDREIWRSMGDSWRLIWRWRHDHP